MWMLCEDAKCKSGYCKYSASKKKKVAANDLKLTTVWRNSMNKNIKQFGIEPLKFTRRQTFQIQEEGSKIN